MSTSVTLRRPRTNAAVALFAATKTTPYHIEPLSTEAAGTMRPAAIRQMDSILQSRTQQLHNAQRQQALTARIAVVVGLYAFVLTVFVAVAVTGGAL